MNCPLPTTAHCLLFFPALRSVLLHDVVGDLLFEGGIAETKLILKKNAEIGLRRQGFEEVADLGHIEGGSEVLEAASDLA